MTRQLLLGFLVVLAVLLAACQPGAPARTTSEPPTPVLPVVTEVVTQDETLEPQGYIRNVHDPVIAHADGTYYIFHTGVRIPFICSKDLVAWEFCGRIFEKNPAWTSDVNPDLVDTWAPDISFFNGLWHLYYAVSTFGTQDSAIGLATNVTLDPKSPDYQWVEHGVVLRSRPGHRWNAIDPNLVLDGNGKPWLAWGSFWEGLWMRKIDASTGMLDAAHPDVYHLADRSAGPDHSAAIEGAFIVQRAGKWYLFASFDKCCQGASSTYNVRVGRSDSLTGPYLDRDGVPMTKGGGTLILSAYDHWKGPGHNGMLVEDGGYWMVYHAYDAQVNGIPKLQITAPDKRWTDLDMGHELYCAGHLIQAAVAWHRALADDRLLNVALRFVDHIYDMFGRAGRDGTCGHPEIETALVELFRVTGDQRHLDLVQLFIDRRGRKTMRGHAGYGPVYQQDHVPVRQATEVAGHAVRQLYLTTGVTDLYMERGEGALLDAMLTLWTDMTGRKALFDWRRRLALRR